MEFKFLVKKENSGILLKKKIREAGVIVYGKQLEQEQTFQFLSVLLDTKLI